MQTCRNCGGTMSPGKLPGQLTCEYCGSHLGVRPTAPMPPRPAVQPVRPAISESKPASGPGPWAGITGMVLGIVGLVLFCVPVLGPALSSMAIVFGLFGLTRRSGRGMAIAGVALGGAGVAVFLVFTVAAMGALLTAPSANKRAGPSSSPMPSVAPAAPVSPGNAPVTPIVELPE